MRRRGARSARAPARRGRASRREINKYERDGWRWRGREGARRAGWVRLADLWMVVRTQDVSPSLNVIFSSSFFFFFFFCFTIIDLSNHSDTQFSHRG